MELNQQEHDRIRDCQVPSHRSQWRSLLQQLLGVEIAHTTTFLDIGHQHQKEGRFLLLLIIILLLWVVIIVLSLAISCVLKQIGKTDKKQLSLDSIQAFEMICLNAVAVYYFREDVKLLYLLFTFVCYEHCLAKL
ncbi:hypothetical protein T12_5118 [Trichinella patagoniensis]|uniref:Uncharacterized protein n=1 Tax=Trichinella patagoniensis TaxID=990121 RepID=A0A0V0ZHG0_9BILA|nr:hypothetical protein T12_5118 [Trichinella patagoniensis]